MAKRHKGSHEEHIDETWLIPYADLLTLLLALFIALFAMSSVNQQKLEAVAAAFDNEFSFVKGGARGGGIRPGDGIMPGQRPDEPGAGDGTTQPTSLGDEGDAMSTSGPGDGDDWETPSSDGLGSDGTTDGGLNGTSGTTDGSDDGADDEQDVSSTGVDAAGEGDNRQLSDLYDAVQQYVADNDLESTIEATYLGDNVLLVLKSDMWFASGSAEVTPAMVAQAVTLARLLESNQDTDHPLDVTVTGHTDKVPIQSAAFPSNWHLSIHRAVNFMTVLLDEANLDPTLFSCRGYGEYRPIATNETPAGRQMNRRVELLVSRTAQAEIAARAEYASMIAADATAGAVGAAVAAP